MANYKKKLVDVTAADIPGVLPEKWVEGGRAGGGTRYAARFPLKTLTLFMTKICNSPYILTFTPKPVSDLRDK